MEGEIEKVKPGVPFDNYFIVFSESTSLCFDDKRLNYHPTSLVLIYAASPTATEDDIHFSHLVIISMQWFLHEILSEGVKKGPFSSLLLLRGPATPPSP